MPCRRLIERREATIARGKTTGAAAAGPSKTLSTALAACDAWIKLDTAANPVFRPPAPSKLRDQPLHHDFAQVFDRYVPIAAACVGRWGIAHPRDA